MEDNLGHEEVPVPGGVDTGQYCAPTERLSKPTTSHSAFYWGGPNVGLVVRFP